MRALTELQVSYKNRNKFTLSINVPTNERLGNKDIIIFYRGHKSISKITIMPTVCMPTVCMNTVYMSTVCMPTVCMPTVCMPTVCIPMVCIMYTSVIFHQFFARNFFDVFFSTEIWYDENFTP